MRLCAVLLCLLAMPATAAPLRLFAAASLQGHLETLLLDAPVPVVGVFAASSTLARQIAGGARAAVLISAHAEWVDDLQQRGHLQAPPQPWLRNELVVIAPAGQPHAGSPQLALRSLLQQPHGRLALGDPTHVPAGRYTASALGELKLWLPLQGRLLPGANVRAALAWVARGEAPLGVVYASDAALQPAVQLVGSLPAAPQYWLAPLQDDTATRQLLAWLQSSATLQRLQARGFLAP